MVHFSINYLCQKIARSPPPWASCNRLCNDVFQELLHTGWCTALTHRASTQAAAVSVSMQFLCVFLLARARSPPIAITDHAASLVGTVSRKLVAKAERGLDLPTVTADRLQSCRARVDSTTLLGCALLLPAGTGTQSLHDLMTTVLGSARHAQYVHHLHHVRMTAWWGGNRAMHLPRIGHNVSAAPAPKCFLMSLRDPAARLRSGFAYVSRHGWGPELSQQVAQPSAAAKTYRGFVAAMRDPGNPDHRFAQALYWSSISKPAQREPRHWDSVLGGLNFLVSQLDYLRGWEEHCQPRSRGEIHFMCAA